MVILVVNAPPVAFVEKCKSASSFAPVAVVAVIRETSVAPLKIFILVKSKSAFVAAAQFHKFKNPAVAAFIPEIDKFP